MLIFEAKNCREINEITNFIIISSHYLMRNSNQQLCTWVATPFFGYTTSNIILLIYLPIKKRNYNNSDIPGKMKNKVYVGGQRLPILHTHTHTHMIVNLMASLGPWMDEKFIKIVKF